MFISGAFHHDKNKWGKFIFFSSDNLRKELLSLGVRGKKKARTIESTCTTKAEGNLTFVTFPMDENYHYYVLKHGLCCQSGYNYDAWLYGPGWTLISPFEQRRNDVLARGGWGNQTKETHIKCQAPGPVFSRDSVNHSQPLTFISSGNLSQLISNFWELCKLPLEHVYASRHIHHYKTKFSFALIFQLSNFFNIYIVAWVFVAAGELSLVVASQGILYSCNAPRASHCSGLSCCKAQAPGHRLSCPTACGIFPDQGLNTCPLHCLVDSLSLDHQGNTPAIF